MLLTSLLRYTINKNQIQQIKLFSKINYTNELFIYLDLMTSPVVMSFMVVLPPNFGGGGPGWPGDFLFSIFIAFLLPNYFRF